MSRRTPRAELTGYQWDSLTPDERSQRIARDDAAYPVAQALLFAASIAAGQELRKAAWQLGRHGVALMHRRERTRRELLRVIHDASDQGQDLAKRDPLRLALARVILAARAQRRITP